MAPEPVLLSQLQPNKALQPTSLSSLRAAQRKGDGVQDNISLKSIAIGVWTLRSCIIAFGSIVLIQMLHHKTWP